MVIYGILLVLGKTLTSFKAAQLVSEIDGIDKVMFVVDRLILIHKHNQSMRLLNLGQ